MCRVHTHIPSLSFFSRHISGFVVRNLLISSFASATLSYSGFFLSRTIFYRLADWSFHVTFIFSCKLFVPFCYFYCYDNFVSEPGAESFEKQVWCSTEDESKFRVFTVLGTTPKRKHFKNNAVLVEKNVEHIFLNWQKLLCLCDLIADRSQNLIHPLIHPKTDFL